jgi:multidrug transporter EmrE-like cation transporter
MSQPWFDPQFAWIPGTALGVLGGFFGSVVGILARRGTAKSWVMGAHVALLGCCVGMLGIAALAFFLGQPYAVWYGLGLAGAIGTAVLGGLLPGVRKVYREAELRKLQSKDL